MRNLLKNKYRYILLFVILTIANFNHAQSTTTFGFQPIQSEEFNYVSGGTSLKVEKLDADNYFYTLYDKSNNLVYSIEKTVPAGGSMIIKPYFKEDGSVKSISTTFNPGGSMYTYSRIITFKDENTPLKSTLNRVPCDNLNCEIILYWSTDNQCWEQFTL